MASRFAAPMNGTGPYEIVLYTDRSGTTVFTSLYWQRTGSVGYSSYNGGATFQVNIGGVAVGSGTFNFQAPAGGPIGETYIGSWSRNVGAVGSALCEAWIWTDTSGAGSGYVNGYQSVATVPPAPTNAPGTPDQITTRGMRYIFNGAGDGGSPITRWEYECWPTGGAPTGVGISSGVTVRNDLLPATEWNWHSRGVNAIGPGPWSAVAKGTTLAASAPSITVAASVSGTAATITGSAPDMPPVTQWVVERRVQGTTTPVTQSTSATNPFTVTGLAPGTIYEWRAQAKITQNGVTYTSPWSNWQATQQPNPNVTPGQYFDGSSPATGDTTFAWYGATNNSMSRAWSKAVLGWAQLGAGSLFIRQVGGRSRVHAGRMVVTQDQTAAGVVITKQHSSYRTDVAEGGIYTGSIYAQVPKRTQRVVARLEWFSAADASLGLSVGAAVVVGPSPGNWTRVLVTDTAPPGAVKVELSITDATGTGWATWKGGDVMLLDDAMIGLGVYPYFDGATANTADSVYDWDGTPDASTSYRLPVAGTGVDPLADPDCPAPPPAPRPPQIIDACVDDITSWRRYWVLIPDTVVPKWIAMVPTITLTSGATATRQARIRFYENPDNLTPEVFTDLANFSSEQVVSYIPPTGVFTIDGVSERARAVVGASGSLPADHMLFGTNGIPATWPTLRCGIGYLMSVDVPLDAPANNLQVDLALTPRM